MGFHDKIDEGETETGSLFPVGTVGRGLFFEPRQFRYPLRLNADAVVFNDESSAVVENRPERPPRVGRT